MDMDPTFSPMTLRRLFNHTISLFIHGWIISRFYFFQLHSDTMLSSAMLSFGLVWIVMLMVLVFFRIQCGLSQPLWLSRFRSFETPAFYERLGIRVYRWLLLHSPFRYANTDIYLKSSRGRGALSNLLPKMLEAEFAHFINVAIVLVLTCFYTNIAVWLLIWNVVFNVYPIALQRYHRKRIEAILEKAPKTS